MKVQSAEFWSREALEKELYRVFDICHGCRLCFHLCPSFDYLFEAIDSKDEEPSNLTREDFRQVVDLCYQCKLCYNVCPYTPPHRWQIDYPRLMLRARAIEARGRLLRLQDRALGNADRVGSLSGMAAPIVNRVNRMGLPRSLLQAAMGIHKERNLPRYHRQTFARWFRKRPAPAVKPEGSTAKAVLFYTCYVNYNQPQVGKATVAVLEKNGVEVECPRQRCCGMPYLDVGDVKAASRNARFNVRSMLPYVEQGYSIVVPGPTCSYTIKREYPFLLDTDEARKVAEATYDVCEFLMKLQREGQLSTDFRSSAGKVAYHLPCHLRAQNIGYKSADLMRLIPDTEVELIEKCAGMDGTWGMKKQYFHLSLKVAEPLLQAIREAEPDTVVSDCPLAAMQIEQGLGMTPQHPLEVLAAAYGIERQ
jgi:glycerol-3-phosphate dehydrogenase subunit C